MTALTRADRALSDDMLLTQVAGMDWSERAMLGWSATRNVLPGLPVEAVRVVPMTILGNDRWPRPTVACCGECGARPGDPEARSCNVANCGLIGRHHGSMDDTNGGVTS